MKIQTRKYKVRQIEIELCFRSVHEESQRSAAMLRGCLCKIHKTILGHKIFFFKSFTCYVHFVGIGPKYTVLS